MNETHPVGDVVKEVRHVAQMCGGEDGVELLALAAVLAPVGREHARSEEEHKFAVSARVSILPCGEGGGEPDMWDVRRTRTGRSISGRSPRP